MGSGHKPNAFIAQIEARKDAEWYSVLQRTYEVDLIAHIISCAEDFQVDPDTAEKCICGYLETRTEIADMVLDAINIDNDSEFLVPKRDIAWKLKDVLGPALWYKYKKCFPMVKEYW